MLVLPPLVSLGSRYSPGLPSSISTWHFLIGVAPHVFLSGAFSVFQITVGGSTLALLCRPFIAQTFMIDLVPLSPPPTSLIPFPFISSPSLSVLCTSPSYQGLLSELKQSLSHPYDSLLSSSLPCLVQSHRSNRIFFQIKILFLPQLKLQWYQDNSVEREKSFDK